MTFKGNGYLVIQMPPSSQEVLDAFENLPLDPYCGGNQRYRRFSQYRIAYHEDRWNLELLPHAPFIQSTDFNKLVGGIPRYFEPVDIDPSREIDALAKGFPLDTSMDWQINVHQIRTITSADVPGVIVPEGPHRDGHHYASLVVFDRKNIRGGVTMLMDLETKEPFFETVLEPGTAFIFDDKAMYHYTTNIEPIGETGHRHMWIVVFNPWEKRRYGDKFVSSVIASKPAGVS